MMEPYYYLDDDNDHDSDSNSDSDSDRRTNRNLFETPVTEPNSDSKEAQMHRSKKRCTSSRSNKRGPKCDDENERAYRAIN